MKSLMHIVLGLVVSGSCIAETWTVDDDGKADFDNIQAAVDAASDGDEIVVMPGTYTGSGTYVVSIVSKSLSIYSSKGAESTIISGQGSRAGIIINQCPTSITINGFKITQCISYSGSGITCASSINPKIKNCIFSDNLATNSGGAIRFYNTSGPYIANCIFTNNTASAAGALEISPNENSGATIIDCTFNSNSATSFDGGAIWINGCNPTINNCNITNNTSAQPGGGIRIYNGQAALYNCTVCDNTPDQIVGNWLDYVNYVADECTPTDTDGDGVPDDIDNCYLYNPDQADCNGNGIGDVCDVADSTSFDCDQNDVPDECQPDCDGDGFIDACDNDADVDGDGIPDNCEEDCNGNTIPDDFEIELGLVQDCNENGVPDECDFADGTVEDCNGNGIPDSCDITEGTEEDCNENDVPDSCEFETVFQEEAQIYASDGEEGDRFGQRLAISGNRAIVTKYQNFGYRKMYLYEFDGTNWIETDQLMPSDSDPSDVHGNIEVAIDGDIAVMGIPNDANSIGCAYIYQFNGNDWVDSKVVASDGTESDRFGEAVAVYGEFVAISAYNADTSKGGTGTGKVYLYKFTGQEWVEIFIIEAEQPYGKFGTSISLDENYLLVSAPRETIYVDGNPFSLGGSVYLYDYTGSECTLEKRFITSDIRNNDQTGMSVDISNGTIAITSFDNINHESPGCIYVYKQNEGDWIESKLTTTDGLEANSFARKVAIDEERIITAATGYPVSDPIRPGRVYIFEPLGSTWQETNIDLSDGQHQASFGVAVDIDNNLIIAGSTPYYSGDGPGTAYIFNNSLIANDCNSNGILDECDLEDPANDQNNNGVIDECECIGDADLDGYVNVNDLLIIIGYWGNNTPQADLNFDGIVNVTDLLIVISNWGPCE